MLEQHRARYPKLGHFDTWLTDLLMLLVEINHGRLLYPDLVCASDFRDTAESFNMVALHSQSLHTAIMENSSHVYDYVQKQFTPEMRHLCSSMGVPVPLYPVQGKHEAKLFPSLILCMPGSFNADNMAAEWCQHIDGINISQSYQCICEHIVNDGCATAILRMLCKT